MDEHVLAAIVPDDETEALLGVEEFDDALGLADDLGRHAAAARATEAAAAAGTRAAEASAAAARAGITSASAAEAITAASATAEAITAAEAAAFLTWTFFPDEIALVFAAPTALAAAPSVETHVNQILSSAHIPCQNHRAGQSAQRSLRRNSGAPADSYTKIHPGASDFAAAAVRAAPDCGGSALHASADRHSRGERQ